MTEPSKKKPPSTESDPMTAFGPMSATAQKVWFDVGLQALQFVSSSMQTGLETQKAMLACKSLEEIQKVQADFYTKAMADYHAQVLQVLEKMTPTRIEGLGSVLPTTKRSYDDVPL